MHGPLLIIAIQVNPGRLTCHLSRVRRGGRFQQRPLSFTLPIEKVVLGLHAMDGGVTCFAKRQDPSAPDLEPLAEVVHVLPIPRDDLIKSIDIASILLSR